MNTSGIEAMALSIRSLSMDAVEEAGSGHPGLPMGCAELGAMLYAEILKHNPDEPDWINRDRFVLSAGHGAMLLFSLLHLTGYGLSLDEIKRFRQVGSPAAGHPEYRSTAGIETTTGPLGQGFSNAVGMAIAERMLAARFNTPEREIIDHYTFVLAGDGCMMEGVASEAASLAGHLGLGKLIVFYDDNHITIDGPTSLAFTEDVKKRFEAYGWQTFAGDAYDLDQIGEFVAKAKAETSKPSFIALESIIGKGSPNKAGTHGVHGSPLGAEEIVATRKALGLKEDQSFFVHPDAISYVESKRPRWKESYETWLKLFSAWSEEYPELKDMWDRFFSDPDLSKLEFPAYKPGDSAATRNAGNLAQLAIAKVVPNLVGGSADLASSNKTAMPEYGAVDRDDASGRTLNFGVREHGMGGVTNGIALHGGFRPFAATFLVFVDYMRPSVRLASIMKLPVIYVFTHDSIYVGEDGPTHQPIEQIESLRIIPNLHLLRPADAEETNLAWQLALERKDGPTAIALTRQNLTVFEKGTDWEEGCRKGAYVAKDCSGEPDVTIVATGSEVGLAIEAAQSNPGKKIRVVSMMCRELFLDQDEGYRSSIVPVGGRKIVVEATVGTGWEGIASSKKDILSIDRFGESGKATEVADHLGMNVEALERIINR